MKLETIEKAPSGKICLKLRIGVREAEIMRSLVSGAVKYTPQLEATEETLQILRNMRKTLEKEVPAIRKLVGPDYK